MKTLRPVLVRPHLDQTPQALPRQSLAEAAVAALRRRILSGEFADGESLNQVAIAREYAISRIPLREAMRKLEAEGLLVFQPGKGAVIPRFSISEISEVVELRSLLEPVLMTRAIPRLRQADFEEAESILDQFDEALQSGQVSVWGELNWRFHATLCAPNGSSIAMGILEGLHHFNQRYARVQISLTNWERRAAREHRTLLALCRRREKQKAASLLKSHILTAGHALIRALEEQRGTKHSREG